MNKKDYKGYELIKAIHDGEIKEGTRIEVHSLRVLDFTEAVIEYKNKRLEWGTGEFDTRYLMDDYYYFRVLEDNTEEIEELKRTENVYDMTLECYHDIEKKISNDELADKINEIIRYIKRKDKNND